MKNVAFGQFGSFSAIARGRRAGSREPDRVGGRKSEVRGQESVSPCVVGAGNDQCSELRRIDRKGTGIGPIEPICFKFWP